MVCSLQVPIFLMPYLLRNSFLNTLRITRAWKQNCYFNLHLTWDWECDRLSCRSNHCLPTESRLEKTFQIIDTLALLRSFYYYQAFSSSFPWMTRPPKWNKSFLRSECLPFSWFDWACISAIHWKNVLVTFRKRASLLRKNCRASLTPPWPSLTSLNAIFFGLIRTLSLMDLMESNPASLLPRLWHCSWVHSLFWE